MHGRPHFCPYYQNSAKFGLGQNGVAAALRELGWLERTLFTLG